MLAYIPYMDPMGIYNHHESSTFSFRNSGMPIWPVYNGRKKRSIFHGGSRRTQGERAHWFLLSHAEYPHPMTVCWLTRMKCIPNERCSATQQCITGITNQHLVGGLEPVLFFHIIGNNNPNCLSYFSEGLKPPTRQYLWWFTCMPIIVLVVYSKIFSQHIPINGSYRYTTWFVNEYYVRKLVHR